MSEEVKNDVVNENKEVKTEAPPDTTSAKSGFPIWNTIIGVILLFIWLPLGVGWLIGTAVTYGYPIWKKKNIEEKAARDKAFAEELAKQMAKQMAKDK